MTKANKLALEAAVAASEEACASLPELHVCRSELEVLKAIAVRLIDEEVEK